MAADLRPRGSGIELTRGDTITLFPNGKTVSNFASLPAVPVGNYRKVLDADDFHEAVQLRTDGIELTTTAVFVEHFFNHESFNDLADRLGVGYATVHAYYGRAVERILKVVEALDKRFSAEKYVGVHSGKRFDTAEKAFILTDIFGFPATQVGEMLGISQHQASRKASKLANVYRDKIDSAAQ